MLGNPDKRVRDDAEFLRRWIWARDLTGIDVGDQKIVLCHYAMLTWNGMHRGSWMLHGHSHGSLPSDPRARRVDVGVDAVSDGEAPNYRPISFDELVPIMMKRTFEPVDHHEER